MDTDERAWPQSGPAGEWTWQEGRGYVLAEDGVTDTRDVAAGLAHGDEQAVLPEEIDRAGEAFDAAVDGQLAANGREPAADGEGSAQLAKLLYDLDQARCALEDDETPEEERATWAEHVAHLEEQATELAEEQSFASFGPVLTGADAEAWGVPDGTPASALPQSYAQWRAEGAEGTEEPEDPDPAGWMSAAEAIANVPEWVAEQGPAAVADWVAEQCDRESTEGDGGEGKVEEPSAAERAVAEAHAAVEAHLDEQDRAPALASAPAAATSTEQEDVDE